MRARAGAQVAQARSAGVYSRPMIPKAERDALQLEHDSILAAEEAIEVWRAALEAGAFTTDPGLVVTHVGGASEDTLGIIVRKAGKSQEVRVVLDNDAAGVLVRRRHVNADSTVPVNKLVQNKGKDAKAIRDALLADPPGLVVANANSTI